MTYVTPVTPSSHQPSVCGVLVSPCGSQLICALCCFSPGFPGIGQVLGGWPMSLCLYKLYCTVVCEALCLTKPIRTVLYLNYLLHIKFGQGWVHL